MSEDWVDGHVYDELKAERDSLAKRIAELEAALLKMCDAADFMPDDVGALLADPVKSSPSNEGVGSAGGAALQPVYAVTDSIDSVQEPLK